MPITPEQIDDFCDMTMECYRVSLDEMRETGEHNYHVLQRLFPDARRRPWYKRWASKVFRFVTRRH